MPGLAGLPEKVGTEVPTGKQFRKVLGQSRVDEWVTAGISLWVG